MWRLVALLAAALLMAGTAGCGGSGAEPGAPQGVALVLDFVPNAVHSGIYAAQREGYYRDAGIDLTIRQPGESSDAPKLLGAGRARKEHAVQAGAGAVLHAKPGTRVRAGEPLITLHTDTPERFARARETLAGAYTIGAEEPAPRPLIIDRMT